MATYYVATNGSNSNDGTIGSPKASAPSGLNPGDTVIYRAGNYFQRIVADASGSSGSPITYQAYTGETVRIYGVSNTNYILDAGGQDWIVFDGFYVEFHKNHTDPLSGSQYRNQWVRLNGDHCTAQNLTINKTAVSTEANAHADYRAGYREEGLNVSGDYVTIDTCTIRGTNKGIRISSGARCKDLKIVNCNIYETVQSGIHAGAGTGAWSGALIQGCRIALSWIEDGIQFFNDPDAKAALRNVGYKIKDCIFYGNGENAIDFKAAYYVTIEDCIIAGTIGSNNGGLDGWNRSAFSTFGQGAGTRSENVILRNCVLFDNCEGAGMKDRPNFKIYNCTIVYNRRDYTGAYTTFDGMAPPQNVGVTCPSSAADGLAIVNNIFGGHAPDGQIALYKGAQTYINHNCYYTGTGGVARNIWRTGSGSTWTAYAWAAWKTKLEQLAEITGEDADSQWLDDHADVEFVNVPDKPRAENYAEYDWRVAATSPAYQAGGPLTWATNSGSSSTALKVADPYFFCDGYGSGLYGGDTIYIGGSPYVINAIDYDTGAVTLASAATWANGAPIYWGAAAPNQGILGEIAGSTYLAPDFSATPTSGAAPLSVTFTYTGSSTNAPTGYSYERNDGTGWAEFATTASPAGVSFAEGIWSIRLTITNADGTATKTRTGYIVASGSGGETQTPTTTNLIQNGDFATLDMTNWKFYTAGTATDSAATGVFVANVSSTGGNTQLYYRPADPAPKIIVEDGKTYVLRFRAKAAGTTATDLSADVLMDDSPYTNLGLTEALTVTTDWQQFEFVFTATAGTTDARIRIRWTGAIAQNLSFDDFEFSELVDLTVSFDATPSSGTAPLAVTLTDTSSGPAGISARSWSIDGAEVSTAAEFSTVLSSGPHTITLTVTDTAGNSGSVSQTISVSAPTGGGSSGGANRTVTRVLSHATGDSATQEITLSGLYDTPSVVIITASTAASDATAAAHARLSFGASDGTTQGAHALASGDGYATTRTKRAASDAYTVMLIDGDAAAIIAAASVSNISRTAVTLNWSTLPASAVYLTVTAIIAAGAAVRHATLPTETNTVTVNDLGFDPNAAIVVCAFDPVGESPGGPMKFSIGMQAGSAAAAFAIHENNANAEGAPTARLGADYPLYQTQQTALDLYQGDLAFITGGFTIQSLDDPGLGSAMVIALDTDTLSADVQIVTTPTSTGAANLYGSALAFDPGLILAVPTWRSAVDADGATGSTTATAGAFGVIAATNDAAYCTALAIEYNSATTDTQSINDDQFLNLPDDTGANAITATAGTWASGNVPLTYAATNGTGRKMIVFALELEEVAASGRSDYLQTSLTIGARAGMP